MKIDYIVSHKASFNKRLVSHGIFFLTTSTVKLKISDIRMTGKSLLPGNSQHFPKTHKSMKNHINRIRTR